MRMSVLLLRLLSRVVVPMSIVGYLSPAKACLGQAKILRSTGRLPMSYAGRTYDGGPLTAKMTSDIGFACIPASLG